MESDRNSKEYGALLQDPFVVFKLGLFQGIVYWQEQGETVFDQSDVKAMPHTVHYSLE